MRCVRPDFTTSSNCSALAFSSTSRSLNASSSFSAVRYTAMCAAVGKVSLVDCPMFTWSFGLISE
ncbi:MAG: hypothetical protein A4E32_01266 [Methanomassiliicoccales archaeon PtaU1.Bin124]|nr:MAG: hypothetical protein A4E32_01266 [Methanomassiliicoccales archaeon PtaU1.Bin124]